MTARSPREERRHQLRLDRRRERMRNLWRILVFSSAGVGLAALLLRQGWTLDSPNQLEVVGSRLVSREQVIEAGHLRFPQPLLTLQPQPLAEQLTAALPVEQVLVTRLMLPPRLRIQLVDREAVARAQRQSQGGIEQGYVDRLGNWMTLHQHGRVTAATERRLVKGWQNDHRAVLLVLFQRRDPLGEAIEEIDFRPDGSLWLRVQSIGQVRLGQGITLLPKRLDVLAHLLSELPVRLQGRRLEAIDLTDPDHPELSLPAPLKRDDRPVPPPARD